MIRIMSGAAVGALVLSMAVSNPARANDAVAVAVGVKLLVGGLYLAQRNRGLSATSANTQYALTGQGSPVLSSRQTAGVAPKGHVLIHCNAHGAHCRTVQGKHPW